MEKNLIASGWNWLSMTEMWVGKSLDVWSVVEGWYRQAVFGSALYACLFFKLKFEVEVNWELIGIMQVNLGLFSVWIHNCLLGKFLCRKEGKRGGKQFLEENGSMQPAQHRKAYWQ